MNEEEFRSKFLNYSNRRYFHNINKHSANQLNIKQNMLNRIYNKIKFNTQFFNSNNQFNYSFLLILILILINSNFFIINVNSQKTCTKYDDLIEKLNKYDPEFDSVTYITPKIRVDETHRDNLIRFKVIDKDYLNENLNSISLFTMSTNNTNFSIKPDLLNNEFTLNFNGKLFYNINNAHRFVVEMTACDQGKPVRCGKSLVFIPLVNYNVHAPSFTDPTVLVAAVTFELNKQLGILNAWDIDGDKVNYALDVSNSQTIRNTIQIDSNGVVSLKGTLDAFTQSFSFVVLLTDDGSSCDESGATRITKSSKMTVLLKIIEVNSHSPRFIPNSLNINYCERTFKAPENSFFRIDVSAQDDDNRGDNGNITFLAPEITDRSPQNSFNIKSSIQQNRQLNGYVYNLETFDFENPKYGSNIMNIMVIAEDAGTIRRRGYCFMTIEITDVNDNVPVFAQRSYTIYIHAQYKTRQFSYRFVAVDKDSGENGVVQYFMDPNSSQLSLNLFSLDLNGTLTIRSNSLLDATPEKSFEFQIYAQDMSPTRNRSELVTVKIIKTTLKLLPPFFSNFPEPAEIRDVSEMTPRGSLLKNFDIVIQTNPAEQFLRCFLSPKPSPEWFKFEYPNPNQALTRNEVCSLRIEDPLNYRTAQSMIVYIAAEVGNYLMSSTARELKILTIYLKEENINPPKFVTNTIEASVVEDDTDFNKVIAVVKAYDLDLTPPFNTITYELDPKSNANQYFSINPSTGEIKLKGKIQDKKNIPLEIIARDGANGYNMNVPNSNTIYVDVKVIDTNNNQPSFSQSSYTFNVPENAQPNYVIGNLDVSDKDTESFFNYSISDSTFGIRGLFSQSNNKAYNYKGSAEIYLNNYLDFKKKSSYDLLAFVSDSYFVVSVKVTINVINVNDRPPEFINLPYNVYINEETIPSTPLVTLAAKDEDIQNNDFLFEFYSTPYLDKSWFNLDKKTGVLTLLKGLDRDLPNGMKTYNLPVSVSYQSNPDLKSYTEVVINLKDINDNPPYLAYGSNNPLIIDEDTNSGAVEIYVIDVDEPIYGPPFTFKLDNYTDEFSLQQLPCPTCTPDRAKYQLINKKTLSRNSQKIYPIAYTVSDNGGQNRTGTIKIIVGDKDNNPQTDGSKQVKIVSFEKNIQPDTFLGTLYVQDKDDWDLITKRSSNCIQTTGNEFEVRDGLQIYGPKYFQNFPKDSMNLQCTVTDQSSSTALAKVDFSIDNAEYADMIDLTGIRLLGTTIESLNQKLNLNDQSGLERFLIKMVNILQLNQAADILKIVTMKNFETRMSRPLPNQIPNYNLSSFGADIYFYVRKSNRLLSSRRIYNQIFSNLNQLEPSDDYSSIYSLFNLCSSKPADFCPQNSFCKQNFILSQQHVTVEANATSFVGLNNALSTGCYCNLEVNQPTCYNGGTIVYSSYGSDYYCNCLDGYEGPRCEFLSVSFSFNPSSKAHSYALFKSIESCDPVRIEFEFITERPKGLLLFNGPVNRDSLYFIAVEIFNKVLLVHIGSTNITFPNVVVSDKQWHKVDIAWSLNSVQVNLDKCHSQTVEIKNYDDMLKDRLTTDKSKLSLGGIPPDISINHYYYNQLNVFEYEGCIRNLMVNGDLRNLKLNQNEYNLAQNLLKCDCSYLGKCDSNQALVVRTNEFPWWIILVILAALCILALILGLAVCTIRRKDNQKKILQMFPDDDIRETIINYADGAGEENTENFNIGVMKKPVGPLVQQVNTTTIIGVNNQNRGLDMGTNDQNMIYAYEGDGSEIGSLSSVCSNCSDKDLDYDYLKEWGPKFVKLSSLYVKNDDPNLVIDYQNHGFEYNGHK